jgi:hypothetical protein
MRYFREVATHQRKVVPFVYLPYCPNSSHDGFIAQLAPKRITRVGGIGDDPSGAHNGHCLPYQTQLGVFWMNRKKLSHKKNSRRFLSALPTDPFLGTSSPRPPKRLGSAHIRDVCHRLLNIASWRQYTQTPIILREPFHSNHARPACRWVATMAFSPNQNSFHPVRESPNRGRRASPTADYGVQTASIAPAYDYR